MAGRCLPSLLTSHTPDEFQSTPGQLAGRCQTATTPRTWRQCFNPRPANWPGDAGDLGARVHAVRVSIHARPIGRAMLRGNPGKRPGWKVSIHARPIGRAMPGRAQVQRHPRLVSIHARPIGRAMLPGRWPPAWSWVFQSTPGQLAGRCGIGVVVVGNGQVVSIHARPIGRAMLRAIHRPAWNE